MNENAAVLHYIQHERKRLDESRRFSFLIDAGANVNGYASDITRTHAQRTDEFGDMIKAFDAGQQELCAAVKPKINYPDLHMSAHRMVARTLEQFKFTRDIDADGIVEKTISSTFFPHGVGHYIGLQVHDVAGFMADRTGTSIPKPPGHPYLRLTRTVEPTHAFTIEPGMYFIEPLLAAGKKLVIPPRANRKVPRSYDTELYKARHLMENFYCRLKQYRAIATRYDKTARNFLAGIHLAAAVIWLN